MRKISSFLFLNFLLIPFFHAKTVYIVPYPGQNPEKQFYFLEASQDEYAKKWVGLREGLESAGYIVKFTFDAKDLEDVTAIISVTNTNSKLLSNLSDYSKERLWLLAFEPPVYLPGLYEPAVTNHFGKIFVMFDDLVDNQHYFKFYYPQPRQQVIKGFDEFSQKKLCILIAGNKDFSHPQALYSERRKAIEFFSNLEGDEFDLYGHGWEGFKSWKGSVKRKWDVLKKYKFCICYENMKDQLGYITEKIFDCLVSGCVPVYWGASNIADYVPKNCFIDRGEFSSEEELYYFLKQMPADIYQGYLDAAEQYFASSEAQLFSIKHFTEIILSNLAQLQPGIANQPSD